MESVIDHPAPAHMDAHRRADIAALGEVAGERLAHGREPRIARALDGDRSGVTHGRGSNSCGGDRRREGLPGFFEPRKTPTNTNVRFGHGRWDNPGPFF